jgi:hypothetical protein
MFHCGLKQLRGHSSIGNSVIKRQAQPNCRLNLHFSVNDGRSINNSPNPKNRALWRI